MSNDRDDRSPHRHDHAQGPHSVDFQETTGSRLLMAIAINLLIPAAQVVGGVFSHSMALISDAIHNFSDFTALLIAYVAYLMGKKGGSPQNTFGYKRAEILGAVIDVALLNHNELGPGPGKRDVHPVGHHQEILLDIDRLFIRTVDEREGLAFSTL
ncbi:MAG: cation transporter [Deltaproteobacteria bacterium]|nr:cation transporter [Deltaproteobacteria bacterium]